MFVFSCSTSLTYIGHWPELKRKKKCFITEANDSFWHLCSIHFFPAVLNFRIQFYHYNKNLVGFSIHVPHCINFLQESGTISRCHCPVDLFRISNLATLLQELILYIVGWYVNFGNIVFLDSFLQSLVLEWPNSSTSSMALLVILLSSRENSPSAGRELIICFLRDTFSIEACCHKQTRSEHADTVHIFTVVLHPVSSPEFQF